MRASLLSIKLRIVRGDAGLRMSSIAVDVSANDVGSGPVIVANAKQRAI